MNRKDKEDVVQVLEGVRRLCVLTEELKDTILKNDPDSQYSARETAFRAYAVALHVESKVRNIYCLKDDTLKKTVDLLEEEVDEAYENVKKRIKHTKILLKED